MNYNTLLYRQEKSVAYITLNRPEVYNALNKQLLLELSDALKASEENKEVRCIVLSGAGKGFCAGQDLKMLNGEEGIKASEIITNYYLPVISGIVNNSKPVICMLHGQATGAGLSVAMACDLIVASENASLNPGFSKIGLMPDSGVTYFFLNSIGPKLTFELLATGDKVLATEAQKLGLINKVVSDDSLSAEVAIYAERLVAGPRQILSMLKKLVKHGQRLNLEEIIKTEAVYQDIAAASTDFKEGLNAFLEKRTPRFN